MKAFLCIKKILLITLLIQSCSNTSKFHGYVYHDTMALDSVCVTDDGGKSTYTDSLGYFVLEEDSKYFSDYLIFSKEGYRTDTIMTVYHRGSIKLDFLFQKGNDTIILSSIM